MTDDMFDFPLDLRFYPPFVTDEDYSDAMEGEIADLEASLRTANEAHSREVGALLARIEQLEGDLAYIAPIDCAEKNCDEDGTLGMTLRLGEVRVEVYLCDQHFDATDSPDPIEAKLDHYRDVFALALEGMHDVWAGDAGPKFWQALDALEKEQ